MNDRSLTITRGFASKENFTECTDTSSQTSERESGVFCVEYNNSYQRIPSETKTAPFVRGVVLWNYLN